MEAQGIIRKISIGDLKEGITYVVGQHMNRNRNGGFIVEQILHDFEYLVEYGINKYDVYVSELDSSSVRIWKSFTNGQISVEYDISVEHEVI